MALLCESISGQTWNGPPLWNPEYATASIDVTSSTVTEILWLCFDYFTKI